MHRPNEGVHTVWGRFPRHIAAHLRLKCLKDPNVMNTALLIQCNDRLRTGNLAPGGPDRLDWQIFPA